MEATPVFPIITGCGNAAKKILFEIASPMRESRNRRFFPQYFYKYQCCGKVNYQGVEYPITLRLLNDVEPQKNNELRIVENPRLTRRTFKVRALNRVEVNPNAVNDGKLFMLSCIILSHAVHGKGFLPSPSSKERKKRFYRWEIDW
ncbi:MAG: hypothetical protein KatS3mg093_262 [Candidatus Parcubacteria bacterium]|nr:MAG: hypothetical protein KatS3mg093_262 [Candidatus Parcubacteria bacterium]